ncbi:MAG: sodium-dependent transporter [Bacteroidales bacterium]
MSSNRTTFATKLGVIAAAVGSAVGLGNIWRFPYEAGQNGGGAFLIVYLICVAVLGIPLIVSEFILGRNSKSNVGGCFKKLAPNTKWGVIGYLSVIACMLILGFYTVIAGWTMEYLYQALSNGFDGQSAAQLKESFTHFTTNTYSPILWLAIFLAANYFIIVGGVKNGIEKASNIMMPLLFVILIIFCIRSLFLPGAAEGLNFLFNPDFTKINSSTVLSAMGQAFFSLSLGMGCLITYGSYFSDDTKLGKTAVTVSILDTLVAILAGVMIFPACFSFGISPTAGPDLVFITVPNVFQQMTGGYIWSILFFLLLTVAALTSTVSMFEVVTAFIHEEYKMSRKKATAWVIAVCFVCAVVCSLSIGPWKEYTLFGMTVFDLFDYMSANILLPMGALLVSLFVGYRLDQRVTYMEITNNETIKVWYFKPLMFVLKYFAPVAIILIFLSGLGVFGK